MDEFWQRVGTMTDSDGSLKHVSFMLMKCALSLTHGNAVSERDFSKSKIKFQPRGYTIDKDTIAVLRLVKRSWRG